ncbi:hypothetical protein CIG19_18565 [Enterobacterales bacterium CwR94]|nr:hypothetical protein CIG19_18565 [Enterobacterales bacterium CwR94]
MKFISLKIGVRNDRYIYFDAHITLMLFLVLLMMMIVLAMAKESVMPTYFFSDQRTIFNVMPFAYSFQPGSSYSSTAYFYKLLGFEESSVIFALISSVLIMATYIFILVKVKGGQLNIFDLGVFLFFVFLSVVNLTWQSKDFIVFLVMLPFLLTFASPKLGLAIWTIGALLFAYYFRSYWFLFVIEFYGLLFVSRFIKSAKMMIVMCLLSMFALAVAMQVVMGVDVDSFRTAVNEIRLDREGDGSNTLITPWVPGGNPVFGWINISITWFTFFVPFPLILMLSPYYLVISFFIIMMFKRIWTIINRTLQSKEHPLLLLYALMIIAFTVIQSMFEPDYGSYLRHLGPFYPFMFYVYLSFGKVNKEN